MIKTALMSACGKFRYRLGRRWGDGPALLFVMLNPSTADAHQDDATIRRCIFFAKVESFPAIDVVNLFAFRATQPKDLRRAGYPVGLENDAQIEDAARGAAKVCLAYGAGAAELERPQIVLPMLSRIHTELHCLRITRSGYPEHPARLPNSCSLMPFNCAAIERAMAGDR